MADARAAGRGVVALETTIVAHGLPHPVNLEVAAACEAAVRAAGAVPATIAVTGGVVRVGLTPEELADLADPARAVAKLSARDLGVCVATGGDGATTVAGTIAVAAALGIAVMATGGLGGVHRGASETYDESADLVALSRYPVCVVASGVKSILDVGATLERLDTLGVPVVGYRTERFPGFYRRDAGFALEWSLGDAPEVARAFATHRVVSPTGLVLANPIAEADELDEGLHRNGLVAAGAAVAREAVTGKAVTPVMLAAFAAATGGASVAANRALVIANAGLAGEVASALAERR
ncbi:MAG: pseudouridine-5-phosphate glycosidase [Actinobacteria bacterium 21-73-9]|nr:MAG: pseudouridine-5-phosphate glycosidase [Actinobacteria bacterium 21-73-9]